MNRRNFLSGVSAAIVISACGRIAKAATAEHFGGKTIFRFAIGSDWHYGEPGTSYEQYYADLEKAFQAYDKVYPCSFFVLNGDVIHNDPQLLTPAAAMFRKLHPRVFTTRGNHDMVTPEAWQQAWGFPLNHDVMIDNQVILLGDTATQTGKYVSPDVPWFTEKLEQYKDAANIFIFVHITPVKWTKHGIDAPEFQALIKKYPNVRAVFNGHDHDEDGVKILDQKIPFLFDSHVGGSWGTPYHGFRVVELKADGTMLSFVMNPYTKQGEQTFARRAAHK
ncbi:metallophosphoesterase family protein [Chitinophaga solisilvae]|uniref:Metallophosphoesterase n=1 Tax=Chitinophaga solisilvae TaxID=1233460 RepID=A0A433WF48_9BACT|nr:metallophosphoesterase [Chitinophaga solisilvae]NSL88691.1 metallophosphoesterase [Chitinophaga solisilvae]